MKIITPGDAGSRDDKRLAEEDDFRFDCHPGLSCFNKCCRNLNLFLYPYDVLRLKNNLGLSAAAFIDQYVDVVMREGNYFPEVLLSMSETKDKTCPFLTEAGCGVYPDRSYSCRMFPVEQGLQFDGSGDGERMVYFFRPPDFCRGRDQDRSLTGPRSVPDGTRMDRRSGCGCICPHDEGMGRSQGAFYVRSLGRGGAGRRQGKNGLYGRL